MVRKKSKSVNIYSVNEPQQETTFISNINNEMYHTLSVGSSTVDMDFHYYDEVPGYSEAGLFCGETIKM